MFTLSEGQLIPLKTVVTNFTAAAGGTNATAAAGIVKMIAKPNGGAITIKIDTASTTISVGDGTWSPEILFEPDSTTTHKLVLVGANIATDVVAYFCTRVCPTATLA